MADPFDDIDPQLGAPARPARDRRNDPFSDLDPFPDKEAIGFDRTWEQAQTSAIGAFGRGAERSLVPTLFSLPTAAAGAEALSAGGVPGMLAGGIIGGFAGGYLGGKAQDFALSHLPTSWTEKIGMDDRQQKLDEQYHGTASFLGGLAPFALTMKPGGFRADEGIKNLTGLQRVLADPLTSRVFSGAVMGGLELGQERLAGEQPDWAKIAISTGFGVVFNRTNPIGQTLERMGGMPVRGLLGRPEPETMAARAAAEAAQRAEAARATAEAAQRQAAQFRQGMQQLTAVEAEALEKAGPPPPGVTRAEWDRVILEHQRLGKNLPVTVAEANDLGVMGPGVTEATHQGSQQRSPESQQAATEQRQLEISVIGRGPDEEAARVDAAARAAHPDLFDEFDGLRRQYRELQRTINDINNPPDEAIANVTAIRDDIQRQLDAHLAANPDYPGVRGRQLRAQLRVAEGELQALNDRRQAFTEGRAEQTADLVAARQELVRIDNDIGRLSPRVNLALREAAERHGAPVVEHPPVEPGFRPAAPVAPETVPAEARAEAAEPAPAPAVKPLDQQLKDIAAHYSYQLVRTGTPKALADIEGVDMAARYRLRSIYLDPGNPERLYRAESVEILRAGARSRQPPVGEVTPRAPRAPIANPSILQFLASIKVRPTADLKAMFEDRNHLVGGAGWLFAREGEGKSLDLIIQDGQLDEFFGGRKPTAREVEEAIAQARDENWEAQGVYPPGQAPAREVPSELTAAERGGEEARPLTAEELAARQATGLTAEEQEELARELTQRGVPAGNYLPEARGQPLGAHPLEQALSATPILDEEAGYAPGSRTVGVIARELRDRGLAALRAMGVRGKVTGPDPVTDEMLSRTIAGEIKAALAREGNSGTWYTQKIRDALAVASLLHPEIETKPNARMVFTAALAVTSQGERVANNVRLAEPVYQYFKDHGEFPTDINAKNAPAMNANFRKLNELIAEGGAGARANDPWERIALDDLRELLAKEFTVRDLEKATGVEIAGENKDTRVHGSAILGPKIGQGFYQNLNENYSPVTMDLWFMRAWGRLTGTLMDTVSEKGLVAQRERLEAALRAVGRRVPARADGLLRAARDIFDEHEKDFAGNRALYKSGERQKSELTYAAERYLHGKEGVNEQPGSGSDRTWMRERVNRARELLAAEGIRVTNADLQAIWWYPEKELYAKMGGVGVEYPNTDYAGALSDLVRKRGISDEQIQSAIRAAGGGPRSAYAAGRPEQGPGVLPQGEGAQGAGGLRPGEAPPVDELFQAAPAVEEGFPLFQRGGQIVRGRFSFRTPEEIAAGQRPVERLSPEHQNVSTPGHEKAHQFMFELARDAKLEHAPQWLKDDWVHALEWLGAKDESELFARRASGALTDAARSFHEKFARGFEAWRMEGRAPSAALARIFRMFATYLRDLYDGLQGLERESAATGGPGRIELTDRMRDVYGHLYETPEEMRWSVIAPEREPAPSMAGTHREDAALTEPQHAEPAEDRVVAERRNAYARDPNARPDTEREPPPEPGGEVPRPPGGAGEIPAGPAQREAHPGAGGVLPGPGDERAGVAAPPGEGQGVAGRGPPVAGVTGAEESRAHLDDQPLAPGPADTLEGRETFNVGKKNNVRTENITSVEQFQQAIEESKDRIPGTDEPVTRMQMMAAAEDMGFDPDSLTLATLERAFGGIKDLGKKLLAFRMAVRDQAEKVGDLMGRIRDMDAGQSAYGRFGTVEGPMADLVGEYAKERDRFDMFMSVLSSVSTEWGRAGHAFRNMDGWDEVRRLGLDQVVRNRTGDDLFQLKMEAVLGAQLKTQAQVAKYLRDARKRSFGGMLLEYFVNNLISGPLTHGTYYVGNKIERQFQTLVEVPIAAGIGLTRQALGRMGERVYLGELGAREQAILQNIPKRWQAGLEGLRTGRPVLLPGQEAVPSTPFLGDTQLYIGRTMQPAPVTYQEFFGDLFGAMKGLQDGIVGGAALIAAGGRAGTPLMGAHFTPGGQIPDITLRGVPVLPVGSLVRAPGRVVSAIHSMDVVTNERAETAALAYREATDPNGFRFDPAQKGRGLEGNERAEHIARRLNDPPVEWMKAVHERAYAASLMASGGEFVKRLSALLNVEFNLPLLGLTRPYKFIDPFVHIGANIIRKTVVERTPAGILSQAIRDDLMGRNGNIAQDTATARMLAGTALAVVFGSLAMEGYVTGSGPSDPNQARAWREVYQPHSVKIGNMWYQMNRLGSLGMHLGIAADLYEVARDVSEGDALSAAAHLQHAITQNILDESFMKGPSDLIKAVEDPGRYGEAYLKNFVGAFMPFSVGVYQMNRAVDPYTRQARTVMDAILQRIPGQSQLLQPRINIYGEPMPGPTAVPGTSIYEQQVNRDPVRQAALDFNFKPAMPERKIRNVELSDAQYTEFATLAGRLLHQRLDMFVRSPDWRTWPAWQKHYVMEETLRQSREVAIGAMFARHPQIARDAAVARREKITGEPVPIR